MSCIYSNIRSIFNFILFFYRLTINFYIIKTQHKTHVNTESKFNQNISYVPNFTEQFDQRT